MTGRTEISSLRRQVIVGGFVALFVGAVILNFSVKRHDFSGINGVRAATSAVSLSSGQSSSAWYCPGPLPIGHRGEQSSVLVTNLSSSAVVADVHISANNGMAVTESTKLESMRESVIALPRARHATYGAVTVLVDGAGVGVSEMATTRAGTMVSPCTTHTSSTTYFGIGSTAGSANMAISLYNPGATPAVIDLGFDISGLISMPAAFTSIPVEPGQDVVVFAGHAIPQRASFSVSVTAISGRIAAGALHFKVVDTVLTPSFVVGTPIGRPAWWFAPTVAAPGIRTSYALVNLAAHRIRVRVTLTGPSGQRSTELELEAHANLTYKAPSASHYGVEGASISVIGAGALAAEREVVADRPLALPAKTPGGGLPASLPPGFGVTSAGVAPTNSWLLTGVRADTSAGAVLGIENPGTRPATVAVEELTGGKRTAIPGLGALVVGPRGVVGVDLGARLHNQPQLVLVVHGSRPILAGVSGYGRTIAGLTAPAGLPIQR